MPGSPLLNLSEISVTIRDSEIFSIKSTTYTPSPHILHAPHAPIEIERRKTMTATPIPAIHARAAGPQPTLHLPKTCFSQTNPAHLSQNTTHPPVRRRVFSGISTPFAGFLHPFPPLFRHPIPPPFSPSRNPPTIIELSAKLASRLLLPPVRHHLQAKKVYPADDQHDR